MKIVKYIPTTLGKYKDNPLVEINHDDYVDIINDFIEALEIIEIAGQRKGLHWEVVMKRLPKHLVIGQHGPNSILTFICGMIRNHTIKASKYPSEQYRISQKQLQSIEECFRILHLIDPKIEERRFQIGYDIK
jgi:hypothetical protein